MNENIYIHLIENAALLLSLGLLYDFFCRGKRATLPLFHQITSGLIIGVIAVVLMSSPAKLESGAFFDTRTILLGLTGLFFGTIPTLLAMAIAGVYRLDLGGVGALTGCATIISSGLLGLVWRHFRFYHAKELSLLELYLFGLLVHVDMILCMFLLPREIIAATVNAITLPVIVIYPVCTALLGNLLTSRQRRHRVEEELTESTHRFNLLAEQSHTVIWEVDAAGLYTYVSPVADPVFGWSPEELVGKLHFYDIHPEEGRKEFMHAAFAVFKGKGEFIGLENPIQTKAGRIVWVSTNGLPVLDIYGNLKGYRGSDTDITERKQAESALRKSEKRFRTLVNTIPDLIWLKDADGIYLSCNTMFERFFGAREADIVGKTDYDFVDKELADLFREHDREAMLAGMPSSNEEWITFADDGHRALLFTTKMPMHGSDGTLIGILGIGRDITELRRSEEEKVKLEDQLHQAQKMESVGSLAGGVAHDFNNKLTVILGHACLALTVSNPTKQRESLEEIRKAAEQSADLTRQLLAFARRQTIVPKVLDLNTTVASMLKMLNRLIGEDIDLAWQPASNLWLLKFDPSQIDQILANLCVNARDSITEGGRITIQTGNSTIGEDYCAQHADALPGEYVRLVVSDNGCGMHNETLDRIFEPFFTTKERGKGTGLGLATVFGIVKQNNGFIDVCSEPGLGTTFTIYLPRYRGKSDPSPQSGTPGSPPLGLETILLVEDELSILNMATMILTGQGYTVLQAHTSTEAIRMVKEHVGEISLLITDVIMPEMNGRELAHNLQSLRPQLKCLYMSGYTADAIAQHGVLEEGVHFIQKPFSLPDLATKVRTVLDT